MGIINKLLVSSLVPSTLAYITPTWGNNTFYNGSNYHPTFNQSYDSNWAQPALSQNETNGG